MALNHLCTLTRFNRTLTILFFSCSCLFAHPVTEPDPDQPPTRAHAVQPRTVQTISRRLPRLESLSTIPVRIFKSTYPESNDGDTDRIAIDLVKSANIGIDLEPGTPAITVFRTAGPVRGMILQDEYQPAVGDMAGLLQYLTKDAKNDAEKAMAIFAFVRDDVKDWWYPAMRGDLSVADLNQLIWSFGYGYCYDLSRLVSGLWALSGLRSRIVSYTKHTVAEVYYDDAWHLFDCQHHSYYLKPDGGVASFAELKADTQLFYQELNEVGLDRIGYPPHHLAHWYSEWEPRFEDSQDGDHWKVNQNYAINLREGEYLDITYAEPGPTYHPDSWVIYYGLKTNRKDPPNPYKGRLVYCPRRFATGNKTMEWDSVISPNGTSAWMVEMDSPFIMSEGVLEIPSGNHLPQAWLKIGASTIDLGRVIHGKIHLTKEIAGATSFQIIIELEQGQTPEMAHLPEAYIETAVNLSQIGLPKLRGGANRLPIRFESGRPHVTLWFKEHAADLKVTGFSNQPEHPLPGEDTELFYTVTNLGSGRSVPTSLTVSNNTTLFLSETTRKVGTQTIPPLEPGESVTLSLHWTASTEMTWYGQNPYVQLIDVWLDIEKDSPEFDRTNNRQQNYIVLSTESGQFPILPGYGPLKKGSPGP